MKEKLIKVGKILMLACLAWPGIGVGYTSAIFFGEYAYPVEKNKE